MCKFCFKLSTVFIAPSTHNAYLPTDLLLRYYRDIQNIYIDTILLKYSSELHANKIERENIVKTSEKCAYSTKYIYITLTNRLFTADKAAAFSIPALKKDCAC